MAHRLGRYALTVEDLGSIPCQWTKSPHATWYGQKQSKKEGNPAICDKMDEPGGHRAKWKTSDRKPQRDFPGGLVAKTLCSQHRGPKFDAWSGN